MSTLAPERPPLTDEETDLLEALDPDNTRSCEIEGCQLPAAFRVACTSCPSRIDLCGTHTYDTILGFQVRALIHEPQECPDCRTRFCAHLWRQYIRITPTGSPS